MQLYTLEVTESGRPKLWQDEIEYIISNKVVIKYTEVVNKQNVTSKEVIKEGRIHLTSHRIILIASSSRHSDDSESCTFVPLQSIKDWRFSKSIARSVNLKSPKVKFKIKISSRDYKPILNENEFEMEELLSMVFNEGVPEGFQENLNLAIQRGAWKTKGIESKKLKEKKTSEVNEEMVQHLIAMGFGYNQSVRAIRNTGSRDVNEAMDWLLKHKNDHLSNKPIDKMVGDVNKMTGIGGFLKMEEKKKAETNLSLQNAFQDLESLFSMAEEMIKLAERFKSSIVSDAASIKDEQDVAALDEMMNFGITSPVTKESAGSLYFEELSRQLSDFLKVPLKRAGGMMTLQEVYCQFNRARGSEFVSPEDLKRATHNFSKTNVPLILKILTSGVAIIQSNDYSENEVIEKIKEIVEEMEGGGPLTETIIMDRLKVPVSIAKEYLLAAENKVVLCRDEGPEGTRFYKNIFKEISFSDEFEIMRQKDLKE